MDRPEPLSRRLTPEEKSLLRAVGQHLGRLLNGREAEAANAELPEVSRKDELGMLVNMTRQVSRELAKARARDAALRRELEQRVVDLERARAEQEALLATIRALSSPILAVHPRVLLVPLIGALDTARAELVTGLLLARIASAGARVVILDVTGVSEMDPAVADRLLMAGRAAALLGAMPILSGVSAEMARVAVTIGVDFSALSPTNALSSAMRRAIRVVAEPGSKMSGMR